MNLTDFHFIRPYWLLALAPAAVVIARLHRNRHNRGNWQALCDAALLPFILQQKGTAASRFPLIIGVVAAVLAIFALAGPSWERLPAPVFQNASALVIALDLSRSMDADDIKPSRLIQARYKISDLLKRRKDGQTALLVFAGEAYVVAPLTNDIATIDSQLSALTTDIMPNPGDNAAAALKKAAELFRQAGSPQGQVILVSDGVDMSTARAEIASLAGRYRVSVLGVGTTQGAPIAAPNGSFLKDDAGNILIPRLDSDGLLELAQAGRGVYQAISASDDDIKRLASFADQASPQQGQEGSSLMLDLWDDKGPWLLLVLLPLAALAFRKGLLGLVLLAAMFAPDYSHAFEWQDLWQRKDQRGEQAYRNNEFAKAASEFENPEWQGAAFYQAGEYQKALESYSASGAIETSGLYYNKGNALAQLGKLPEAVAAYDKALELDPGNEDAKFNKELLEKEVEKQKQQNQGQKKDKPRQAGDNQSRQGGQQDKKNQDGQSNLTDDGQKPEQKPERTEKPQAADGQQQQSLSTGQQKDAAEPKQGQSVESEAIKAQQDKRQPFESTAMPLTEEQQANEQWLKRIPDDPSGLLRRKFKYQYGQQKHQQLSN